MKKFFFRVAFIFLFFIFSHGFSSDIFAQQPTIKVMSWNIDDGHPPTEAEQIARMNRLAEIIAREQAEVVLLQEFLQDSYVNTPRSKFPKLKINNYETLLKALEERNWKMYGDFQSYFETQEPGVCEGLCYITLSRYPLDLSSKRFTYAIRSYNKDDGKVFYRRSGYTIMTRRTPIGDFRLSNIHTHAASACSGFGDLVNFYKQHDPKRTIMMGDLNLNIRDAPNVKPWSKFDTCGIVPWSEVKISCQDKPCLDSIPFWKGGPPIDFILRFTDSEMIIKKSWNVSHGDARFKGVNNPTAIYHPVVFGEITSTVSIPTGHIDEVNGNDCYITGWSCDMNKPTQPLDIHVYHTRLESNNFIGSTKANMPRTDVADAGKCNGHPSTGFLFKLPDRYRDGVTRTIHLHALGINADGSRSNNNPPLTGSPVILTCKKVESLPSPANLTQQCGGVASADKMNSQFSWSQVNGAERYVLRINKRNTCTNDSGQTVEWFCPETDGRGDVWQFVPASNCSSGRCNYTHPLLANTEYTDWSVQAVRPGGTGQLSEGGQSPQQTGFRCLPPSPSPSPTPPPQPIEGDINSDGVVNQTDYNLMVTNLYTNNCNYTVPKRSNNCMVTIGDLNRLVGIIRK